MRFILQFVFTLLALFVLRDACCQIGVLDLEGHQPGQLGRPGDRVVVLIFAATDCPISKRYVPEVARLQGEFDGKGVAFWWVFPNPGDTAAVVRQHELDYSIHGATLIDSRQELVGMAHVSVTPEAAVFVVDNGQLRETYHGRIDDLYASFGHARPHATHHDLRDAIAAALTGRPAPKPDRGPVGCSIIPLSMVTPAQR